MSGAVTDGRSGATPLTELETAPARHRLGFHAVALIALALIALRTEPASAADGGSTCASSGECGIPTPYCSPASNRCVECLSDRNCSSGNVCDSASGTCRGCLSDADCSGLTPYCSLSLGHCIECSSDANCGNFGLSCIDGKCGSCGDGICAPREGLFFESFSPFGPQPLQSSTVCARDCITYCPTKDLGSELGKFTVDGSTLRNLFSNGCGEQVDGVDASFAWKAPRDDTFAFIGSGVSIMQIQEGGCTPSFGGGCTAGFPDDAGRNEARVDWTLSKGQEVLIVVEAGSMSVASMTLEIAKGVPSCGLFGCPPPSSGSDGGGEGGNDQGATICLRNAEERGEALCSGVDCACHHCPRDYDDCAVIPGCGDVVACMRRENCVATECYNSGACRKVIDSFGGVSGPAFGAGSRLQSCELTFACGLPCSRDGGVIDGSAPSTPDAGHTCEPGRKVICTCEAGTGEKTCVADGTGYGRCSCGAKAGPEGSGCDCRLGHSRPKSPNPIGAPFALGAVGFLAARWVRRRSRAREKSI